MDPLTALFSSISSLLAGIDAAFIKPNKTNQNELLNRRRKLDKAYVRFELAMNKLLAQLEQENYAAATADLMKLDSALDRNFSKIINLVDEIRANISRLDIQELSQSLIEVAKKCSKIFGLWIELQVAVIREDHNAIKRLCRLNRKMIKAYVEEIKKLADLAEIALDRRQFRFKKPQAPAN